MKIEHHHTAVPDSRVRFSRVLTALVFMIFGTSSGTFSLAAENAGASFPNRPIRIIVGFAPGGTADIVTRIMAEKLSEDWKQAVIVDNRPGASGAIGVDIVAKSAKDGYTMGTISGTFTIVPALGQKLPFDVHKDFTVVNRIVQFPFILATGTGGNMVNVKSFSDFINTARSKPKLVSYASSGPGSVSHLSSELMGAATKVDFLHVPYKGTGAAITDIIGGRVDFTLSSAPEILGFLKNKQLRGLAVMTSQRLAALPDVPPITDSLKGLELGNWFAFLVPSGVPRPILERLNVGVGKAATSEKLKPKWEEQTTAGTSVSLKDADDHYRSELKRWDTIVKSLGLENLNK